MIPPSVEECEKYLRDEIARIDSLDPHSKTNADYFNRNVLLYGWLLQRRWFGAKIEDLGPLVGVTSDTLRSNLHDVRIYLDKVTDSALHLYENMEVAVENVFNDPTYNYNISQNVPHFGDIAGFSFLEYMNNLATPNEMSFPSLMMNAIRAALPDVRMEMPFSDSPNVRLVIGPGFEGDWHFVIGVFPHNGMLTRDEVDQHKGRVVDIRDELQDTFGILHTIMVAPGVDDEGRMSIGRNRYIHYLWGLSALRFFHVFEALRQKHEGYHNLLVAGFPVIFETDQASTIFSIREGLQRLDDLVEAKKKEA